MSSFLDNLMRSGAQSFNAKVTLSGTTVTISGYEGPYTENNPLLVRFNSTDICVYTGADLVLDFGSVDFGLPANSGSVTLFVGLMRVNSTTVIPTLSLFAENGVLTTVTNPREPETYAGSVQTGPVILIARIMNVERVGGWLTTNSWIEE
jgi:hypothetical protein